MTDSLHEACAGMNAKRLTRTLIELCEIPSPSKKEGAVAVYIRERIHALGLFVEEDDAGDHLDGETGNLLVKVPGSVEPPLLLTAHMDTVSMATGYPDCVNVIITDGVVHTDHKSPLGADDKAGLAIALELLHHKCECADVLRPLELVFTVQEEIGARGANYFDTSSIQAEHGFVLDGDTPVGTVIVRSPQKFKYELLVRGCAAHAALEPEKGLNAIRVLSLVTADLPHGRIDDQTTTNFGIIEGGTATNVVPDRARLVGELRGHSVKRLRAVQKQIVAAAERTAATCGTSAEVAWTQLYPGYEVARGELCNRLFRAGCQNLAMEPDYLITDGGGDANPLNGAGITCVPFGLGMQAIHTNDECIRIIDLHNAFRLLLECVAIRS